MRLTLTIALLFCLVASVLLLTDRADKDIAEYRQNEFFALYCEYVFAEDYGTPPARMREIEAWARGQDPETIDAVNVRAWMRGLKGKPKVKERMKKR